MPEPITRVPRMRKIESSNSRPAKSYMTLQSVRHRFKLRSVAEMDTANSLHSLV